MDVLIERYKVISRLKVPSGKAYELNFTVEIKEREGSIYYFVYEPYDKEILIDVRNFLEQFIQNIKYSDGFFLDPVEYILDKIGKISRNKSKRGGSNYGIDAIKYVIIKDIIGYRSITPLLSDENLEDISLSAPNSYVQVWHRKYNQYGWALTNIYIDSSEALKIINRLAFRSGKSLNLFNPLLEGVLPENYRVVATWLNEVSPRGSSFTIRKFKSRPYTIVELVKEGLMPLYLAAYLWILVDSKKFIMIIGPSGAGKTTLLNSLLLLIPPSRRIISIEETPEIYLYSHPGWKPLTTRYDRDPLEELLTLLKYSLRERADYIVLGESRGLEARLVFQGAATGHGCITTFHASSLKELYARLSSKPISLDNAMFKLLDTVVVLKMIKTENMIIRRVIEVYKQKDGNWRLIYKYQKEDVEKDINRILSVLDEEDQEEFYKRLSFLNHLLKISAVSPEEFLHRILLFYAGKYRYLDGKWLLKMDISR